MRRSEVGVGDSHPRRRPALESGDRVDARRRHDHVAQRAHVRPRPDVPAAGKVEQHNSGVDLLEHFVSQAHPLHRPGPEVVRDHVRLRDELFRDLLAFIVPQVERDRQLAGVGVVEHRVNTRPRLAVRAHAPPPQAAMSVALDLDDLRAEVRQHPGAERPGQHPAEVSHSDALQRSVHVHWSPPALGIEVAPIGIPSSAKTSSVCSPSSGALVTLIGSGKTSTGLREKPK